MNTVIIHPDLRIVQLHELSGQHSLCTTFSFTSLCLTCSSTFSTGSLARLTTRTFASFGMFSLELEMMIPLGDKMDEVLSMITDSVHWARVFKFLYCSLASGFVVSLDVHLREFKRIMLKDGNQVRPAGGP